MVTIFEGRNCNVLYLETLKGIQERGISVSPRNLVTKELSPAITVIHNPQERILSCYKRNINPFFLTAEALWILAGRGDVEFIKHYNSKLNKYDDGDYNFHGAYGMRTRRYGVYKDNTHMLFRTQEEVDQLKEVYLKLSEDKDTRQAVICLWNPFFDNIKGSKDYPCNNLSYFTLRDNKLHLHQIVRSNDVNLGLYPTNIFQFSIIQEVMASWIGAEVGELIFYSNSLHCYQDKVTLNMVEEVLSCKPFDMYAYIKTIKCRERYEKTQEIVKQIMKNEESYRDGKFDLDMVSGDDFWMTLELMLKIYNLRKHKLYNEAIENTSYIPANDFKISAYQYHYRKASEVEKRWIMHYVERDNYPGEIIDFITT